MKRINKKFAWIVDGSGANSWGVKNDEAVHLKDDTPLIGNIHLCLKRVIF